ncbi:MAG: ECF transporter S component [Clostridiales Family XIII bacterium]|jgi:ABC-type thiamin/hydroxymethylpyrimidine transport system permease subunit|nr:ECF transporter S component [Clostridiales Family XIII bacterium]
MLKKFSTYDIIIIAVMAAVGVAIKPVVSSAVHLVSAPLMIPGGSLAGGLYMMWLVLAAAITGKPGSATLCGIVQAVIVVFTGIPGSHGVMSFVSYTAPGVCVDVLLLLLLRVGGRDFDLLAAVLSGIVANLAGTYCVNIIFFHLPALFLALTLCAAALSGAAGGAIANALYKVARKYRLVRRRIP